MSLPDLLAGATEDEDVVANVDLGGEDILVVTPTRTLVYRAEGLLSDERVEEYPHEVERLDIDEKRRKSKITLDYGLDGEETVSVPSKRLDDVVHPVLAGVLSATGLTDAGESVLRTFRFSELTLIVTSGQLVKNIGSTVWDEEYEAFPFEHVTDLDFEEGTVATSVVLTHAGRQERFKAPNESAREIREVLSEAVCEYHGVESIAELRLATDDDDAADEEPEAEHADADFGDGPDPLSASPSEHADPDDDGSTAAVAAAGGDDPLAEPDAAGEVATGAEAVSADRAFEETGFETPEVDDEDPDLAEEVAALRETVEAQSEQLDRQAELVEQLIEELRRGR